MRGSATKRVKIEQNEHRIRGDNLMMDKCDNINKNLLRKLSYLIRNYHKRPDYNFRMFEQEAL